MAYAPEYLQSEPVRRRSHRGRWLLVLLLVLLLLALVADRVSAYIAARTVASQAKSQLEKEGVTLAGDPEVSIDGFPFLTQVAAGHYDKIDIKVTGPTTHGVRLDELDVVATGIDADTGSLLSGGGTISADKVTGTATIAWKTFTQMVDLSGLQRYGIDPDAVQITSTSAGNLRITAPLQYQGQTYGVQASGKVSVDRDVLHVAVSGVQASDGTLPAPVQDQLSGIAQQLNISVRVPPLPYHLSLDDVRTTDRGISITASAHGVVIGA